jgi:hypothetical protein
LPLEQLLSLMELDVIVEVMLALQLEPLLQFMVLFLLFLRPALLLAATTRQQQRYRQQQLEHCCER